MDDDVASVETVEVGAHIEGEDRTSASDGAGGVWVGWEGTIALVEDAAAGLRGPLSGLRHWQLQWQTTRAQLRSVLHTVFYLLFRPLSRR